jgi:hypothetical protein
MKMRLRYFLGCLGGAFLVLVSYAGPTSEIIELFPTGSINWTRGAVTAMGNDSLNDIDGQTGQAGGYDRAYQQAIQNLRQTLKHLRMNSQNYILDLLSAQTNTLLKTEEMTSLAKVVETIPDPDGGITVTLEMSLYGGFAQLMLPSDVQQVEPIVPLNGDGNAGFNPKQTQSTQDQSDGTEPDAYSGLIVDARGIGASPSMVPILEDENGQEVYGPAYVSREFAVQHGMCRYIRGFDNNPNALPRIAPNPMVVKGLRAISMGSCDIVISNSDASKLRGASSHLKFLKQCRVVIIID